MMQDHNDILKKLLGAVDDMDFGHMEHYYSGGQRAPGRELIRRANLASRVDVHSERMRRPGDEEFLAEKKKAPLVMALGTISTPQGTVKFRKRLQ